jgi:spermidine/putrescine ABC transporter ATP-binding subunit
MTPIIKLRSLRKTFQGLVAVDDVDLDIEKGEFLTILGPSGCGKTTTLRLIGGFEYPDSGNVYLDGEDITDLEPYDRLLNMMFQDFALFPHMTVFENIRYGLRFGNNNAQNHAKVVDDMLNMIHLSDKAHNKPHELSVGQRQRVALARALVRKPKVLLLDEPLSALDAKLRDSMQLELKQMQRETELTFVMVTHDQTEAMGMSDRIMLMKNGKVIQIGTPDELYNNPASPYVADFFGASNIITGVVKEAGSEFTKMQIGDAIISIDSNGVSRAIGESLTVAIRPERILLKGENAEDDTIVNRIQGTVTDHLFHGNLVHILVDIGNDDSLTVQHLLQSKDSKAELPQIGSSIVLEFDPSNVTVFGHNG